MNPPRQKKPALFEQSCDIGKAVEASISPRPKAQKEHNLERGERDRHKGREPRGPRPSEGRQEEHEPGAGRHGGRDGENGFEINHPSTSYIDSI